MFSNCGTKYLLMAGFMCMIGFSYPFLIFPKTSVYQITMSMSSPVVAPNHKMFCDWGFQANYDLPWNLTYFYSIPIWPGIYNKREAKELDYEKYQTNEGVHSNDYTAGEFYEGLENILVGYGFHETCLLKSVCELARYPFHDDEENLLTEMFTFILSPSMHEAFGKKETIYKETYEAAENQGFLGGDCDKLYPLCTQDILSTITKIMTSRAKID